MNFFYKEKQEISLRYKTLEIFKERLKYERKSENISLRIHCVWKQFLKEVIPKKKKINQLMCSPFLILTSNSQRLMKLIKI